MDWDTLRATLQAACDDPADDAAAERAVAAAEIVVSTAGEPPDELPDEAREWVETHGVPEETLVELACRSMKSLAARSDEWHERLNDLRFRLGDVAAA
ncbi:MAG TPA: DUF4259 domain-containing protein [Gaiellaceae bacterium]